jgi:rare lipoprotein A
VAAADPAPIVYASRNGASSAANNDLLGGDANAYGYGGQSGGQGGSVIDLRRNASSGDRVEREQSAVQNPDWHETERVGPPYEANGRWYVPTAEPAYDETGTASWYGPQFHGQRAANGEVFDQTALSAAHPTLPLNALVQVTNLQNGREVILRITDRGPFVDQRLIDLSHAAAVVLGFEAAGHAQVRVRYLGPAPQRQASPHPTQAEGPAQLQPEPLALAGALPDGGYLVQLGAFANPDNAQRVGASAQDLGLASIDLVQTPAGPLHRVRLGPFGSAGEADAARAALIERGIDATVARR